jgi:hypothetical protein
MDLRHLSSVLDRQSILAGAGWQQIVLLVGIGLELALIGWFIRRFNKVAYR